MDEIEQYKSFLAQVRAETGIEALSPDEDGLVSIKVDDHYSLNLQLVKATGKVLCFVEVTQLPKDSPAAVYRDLLVGGLFGKDTAGGYFSIEAETESVIYNYFFDLDKIAKDVDDFVSTLEKILQLCDIWVARITSGGATADDNAKKSGDAPIGHMIQV